MTPSNSKAIKKMWNLKTNAINAMVDIAPVFKSTHGMFSGVPILCRSDTPGKECPYLNVCMVEVKDRVVGGRCPMEAAAVVGRFEAWCKHFDIAIDGDEIKPNDLVDATLIRDLVDNEISMLRADNRIAINSDFIGQTLSQISNKGKAYYENTVTPEAEYKLSLQDRRYKILNLLNSTRKDKASEKKILNNPSSHAASLFKKVGDLLPIKLDEMDFDAVLVEDMPALDTNLESKEEDMLVIDETNNLNKIEGEF